MMVAISLASCPLFIGLRVASSFSGRASVAASRRGAVQYLRTAARNLGTTAETGTKNGKKKSVLIPSRRDPRNWRPSRYRILLYELELM
jgi:hypothetical protein